MAEVHSSTTADYSIKAKKLWSFLRIAFFMIRKGLISKRKLMMDMNLLVAKRGKVLRKTLGNYLMFHHSKNITAVSPGGFGIGHYEFSCTNTPINPSPLPFFHAAAKRKHHHYFPCINPPPPTDELEEEFEQVQQPPPPPSMVLVLPTASKINYSSKYSTSTTDHFAPEEKMNPVMVSSPLSVRVSNYYYSSEEEEENEEENEGKEEEEQVDVAAEDFIRRFYEQLRMQNGTHLIQYQEIQYQEMLARGTC